MSRLRVDFNDIELQDVPIMVMNLCQSRYRSLRAASFAETTVDHPSGEATIKIRVDIVPKTPHPATDGIGATEGVE